jgi:hypothetical protein
MKQQMDRDLFLKSPDVVIGGSMVAIDNLANQKKYRFTVLPTLPFGKYHITRKHVISMMKLSFIVSYLPATTTKVTSALTSQCIYTASRILHLSRLCALQVT